MHTALSRAQAILTDAVQVEREVVDQAPTARGAYVLVIALDASLDTVHKRAALHLPAGVYLYCGSAYGPGGIRARLRRHFRRDKRPHWHVDALTIGADAMAALVVGGGAECALVNALKGSGGFDAPIPGFGSSDCAHCPAHLLVAV